MLEKLNVQTEKIKVSVYCIIQENEIDPPVKKFCSPLDSIKVTEVLMKAKWIGTQSYLTNSPIGFLATGEQKPNYLITTH